MTTIHLNLTIVPINRGRKLSLENLLEDLSKDRRSTKLVVSDFGNEFEKIELIPFGDIHYGHKHLDRKLLKSMLEYMYNKPNLKIIGMGDMLEASTTTSVGGGIFEQDSFIQTQYEHMAELLAPLADEGKIVGLHTGNHELRIYKHSGFNPIKTMCRELKVKYLDYSVMHLFRVGKQTYPIYSTHGSSGATTPGGRVNALLRLGMIYDAEVYLMGHLHSLEHFTQDRYKVDLRNKTIKPMRKHYLITGSYMDYWGTYAQSKGYQPGQRGSPKLKFHRDEHGIRVSM